MIEVSAPRVVAFPSPHPSFSDVAREGDMDNHSQGYAEGRLARQNDRYRKGQACRPVFCPSLRVWHKGPQFVECVIRAIQSFEFHQQSAAVADHGSGLVRVEEELIVWRISRTDVALTNDVGGLVLLFCFHEEAF